MAFERVPATFLRLDERLRHQGTMLSGGDQQMLSIGRALTTHLAPINLDEATEGLVPLFVRHADRRLRLRLRQGAGTQ